MERYIASPVKGQPNRRRIYDTLKGRHLNNSSGIDTYIKEIAEMKIKQLNEDYANLLKSKQ